MENDKRIIRQLEQLGAPGSAEFGMALLSELSHCSLEGPGVTRLPYTAEHKEVLRWLRPAMESAGLTVSLDAAGTLRGRREAYTNAAYAEKTLYIGSHQDSIVHGGRFDGSMGVVLGISVMQRLVNQELPFAIELLVFADEEGVRFPTALMGPRALANQFNMDTLELRDKSGMELSNAMSAFGLDPTAIPSIALSKTDSIAYLEAHIEQGPVLESKNLPVGVVSGICGIERWQIVLQGRSDHAGTTPLELRKDALCLAAQMILEVEQYCLSTDGLVGVVGELNVLPNVVNAVPGQVTLSLELRSPNDAIRESAGVYLREKFQALARKRKVDYHGEKTYSQKGVICDKALQVLMQQSIRKFQIPELTIMSGATHDASAMADLCPVAMLFVRCRDGISHHPDESIQLSDYKVAIDVLLETVTSIESEYLNQ